MHLALLESHMHLEEWKSHQTATGSYEQCLGSMRSMLEASGLRLYLKLNPEGGFIAPGGS